MAATVGALLQINMLFANVGPMLQINSDRYANTLFQCWRNVANKHVISQCWFNVANKQ